MPVQRSSEFAEMMAQFSQQVRRMPYNANSITIFAEMPIDDKIESFIAGVMVGMMIALREQVRSDESMETFERYIIGCLPAARKIANEYEKESTGR